ncbi:MAG: hypothetical protein FD152_2333 [Xanthobacteraceae bacterium]|nr:MAG: hypothetical protein FD152_2333 [Xanthobacteraceae bacterium]
MTVGVRAFKGQRLKQAREARGLFKNTLGDLIGVSGTAIARYEEGVDCPQQDKFDALARVLGFPHEFFLKPANYTAPDLVFWRSKASETKTARSMTEQRMIWLTEIFEFLESEVQFPELDIPKGLTPENFRDITPADVEAAAERLRAYWSLRDLPIPDMFLALENAGIPVVSFEVESDKQDGFCFWSRGPRRPFVGVNRLNISAARARYDAAHELGHVILHSNVTREEELDPANHKIIESQAHRFAGAFLFPRAAFRREIVRPSLDYFCSVKPRWGLSIAAMVNRAYHLGLIGEDERSGMFRNMARRKWRGPLQEPYDALMLMPLERPRMLRRAIEVILQEGYFGHRTILSQLALPAREVEQLTGLDGDYFSPRQTELNVAPRRGSLRALNIETGNVVDFPSRGARGR